MHAEIKVPFFHEFRYFNKKTGEYESSSQNLTASEEDQKVIKILQEYNYEKLKADLVYYDAKLQNDYNEAAPE